MDKPLFFFVFIRFRQQEQCMNGQIVFSTHTLPYISGTEHGTTNKRVIIILGGQFTLYLMLSIGFEKPTPCPENVFCSPNVSKTQCDQW